MRFRFTAADTDPRNVWLYGTVTETTGTTTSGYDPATNLALTGWWQAGNYDGAGTWTGTASLGSSGSRNLTEATNYPGTAALNGLNGADFDGINDQLANATAISTLLNASAYGYWVLFAYDSISGSADLGGGYANEALVADSAGYWWACLSTVDDDGVMPGHFHGSAGSGPKFTGPGECAATTVHLLVVRYDGSDIYATLDSISPARSAAQASIDVTTGTLIVGKNYDASKRFNGRIWDIGMMASDPGASFHANIKSYINARYALSFT